MVSVTRVVGLVWVAWAQYGEDTIGVYTTEVGALEAARQACGEYHLPACHRCGATPYELDQ